MPPLTDKEKRQARPATKEAIGSMFDAIAPTYDRVNAMVSLGLDRSWRNKLTSFLPKKRNLYLLDLATGTADQLLALMQRAPHIHKALGMDISPGMIEKGKQKVKRSVLANKIELRVGDALATGLKSSSIDCITMSFGLRNVVSLDKCFNEAFRILAPSGRLIILELSRPKNPLLRWGHKGYLKFIVPMVGALISKKRYAYRYLQETINEFASPSLVLKGMKKAQFTKVRHIPLSGGIVSIYVGDKS